MLQTRYINLANFLSSLSNQINSYLKRYTTGEKKRSDVKLHSNLPGNFIGLDVI